MRRALQRMDRLVSSYKVGEYESVYIPFQCRRWVVDDVSVTK